MKVFICLTLLFSVAMYALASSDDEFDSLRMVKINVHILQGKCLDRLEDMHDNSRVFDPEFYFLVGKVSAYDDCIKLLNVIEARQCKADLH